MPPPSCARLLVKKLVVTVSWPLLLMAPPPERPSFAMPLVRLSESRVSLPDDATSNIRKDGVPAAVDLVIVAPLPTTVTFRVITGSPVPPSVALLAAVSVYTHPGARVTVPPATFAAEMAVMRSAVVQGMAAAAAVSGAANSPNAVRAVAAPRLIEMRLRPGWAPLPEAMVRNALTRAESVSKPDAPSTWSTVPGRSCSMQLRFSYEHVRGAREESVVAGTAAGVAHPD